MRDVTLNQQEQARIQVLNSVLEYQLPIAQAAEIMGVSERHTKRLLAAYRKVGPAALAHGNRGRRPHNAVPEVAAAAVVKLASNGYAGANHTHLTELLREREGIDLSRPTVVRRILTKAGIGSPRSRRSQQHRFRRRRLPQEGMLVQIDGSNHPWLEDRGPKLTLLIAVDDATGTVAQAAFRTSEDTRGYLVLLEGLVRQWGIPLALYSDRHSAFKYNAREKPVPVETTQFARVMREAGQPADLRPLSPSQGTGGADAGNLPGPAGHRAAPGRRQHHGPGQRGPPGVFSVNYFCRLRRLFLPVHPLFPTPLLGHSGSIAGDVEFQDDRVVDHPVDGRRSGHGVSEDMLPLGEDQVGRDAQGPAFVAFGDEREEHLGLFGPLGQVPQVVQHQEIVVVEPT